MVFDVWSLASDDLPPVGVLSKDSHEPNRDIQEESTAGHSTGGKVRCLVLKFHEPGSAKFILSTTEAKYALYPIPLAAHHSPLTNSTFPFNSRLPCFNFVTMKIRIGTSGYSYDDWKGHFYPETLPKSQMLEYYAQRFDTVEINSTYYGIPRPSVCEKWAEKTPDGFEFMVKTHQEATHKRENYQEAMRDLNAAVQPLAEAQKLAGFLAQFPYSFKNTPENRDYLCKIRDLSGEHPLFVEFRNWTWTRAETFHFLKENNIGYVNVDGPRLRGLLPPQQIVTSKAGYIRFHGRNAKDWWEGTNVSRYDYLYSKEELDGWKDRISNIYKISQGLYIYFNNHPHAKAVVNAFMVREMLED